MSASREKKKRMDEVNSGSGSGAQEKKGLGKPAKIAIGIIVTAVILAVLIFFALITGDFMQTHTTAAVAHGHELTPGMVNIYYNNALQSNAQTMSYFTDPEKPLDEQAYISDEFATWGDFLMKSAVASANASYSIYDEAMEKGFELSEESKSAIQQEVDSVDAIAAMNGYPSGNSLLAASYGKGTNLKAYEEYLRVNQIAQEYSSSIVDGLSYTQEELDAYYGEHSDDFDAVDFRMFSINAEVAEDAEAPTADALTAAEEAAKAAVEASENEAAYLEQAAAQVEDEEYDAAEKTLLAGRTISSLPEMTREWLADDARKAGDVAYFGNGADTGFYVVYYIGTTDIDYQTINVRHILVSFPEEADDAAKAEVKAKAEEILNTFKAGEATEDAFAELAVEKSEDPGSAANGGLYENVVKGSMVEAFDSWCFDADRKVGDSGLVETEYGYHVMYFSGYGMTYKNYAVEQTMMNEDFTEWRDNCVDPETFEITNTKFVTTR